MQISMKDLEKLTLREMEDLLAGSRKISWTSEDAEAKYNFISAVLKQQSYSKLGKRERGVVRQFLGKVAAVSRAQTTRLIAQWMEHRTIKRKAARRPSFVCRYRKEDLHLLAATDAAHEDLSGPALRRILHREHQVFGKPEYERLSQISVSHIYNLRRSTVYRQQRVRVQPTQSRQISHWRATQARSQRQARVSARRYRASGAARRQSRRLSHPCRRHCHAMAGLWLRGDDQ